MLHEPPKRSPFDAVRWDGERYSNRWQKRIDEDLVEVLKLLGAEPGPSMTLTVDGADGRQTLSDVEATFAKRARIWKQRIIDAGA